MRTVLVFGAFDGLHPGHDYFLREARKLGDRLIVCLARDSAVEELKGRAPKNGELARREALAENEVVESVIYGDREQGSYQILDDVNPDVIAVGYDQQALKKSLDDRLERTDKSIPIVTIDALDPDRYKSSLLP